MRLVPPLPEDPTVPTCICGHECAGHEGRPCTARLPDRCSCLFGRESRRSREGRAEAATVDATIRRAA